MKIPQITKEKIGFAMRVPFFVNASLLLLQSLVAWIAYMFTGTGFYFLGDKSSLVIAELLGITFLAGLLAIVGMFIDGTIKTDSKNIYYE